MNRLLELTIIVCSICALASAQDSGGGLAESLVKKVDGVIRAKMERDGIPGLSAAIGRGGELIWTRGYGFADLENQVAATEKTVYRLASISKPMTSVCVMQLVEQGKIDLDAEVQELLPSFPAKRWPLTARHLLGHLGGVRHYKNPQELASAVHYLDLTKPLSIFKDDPLLFEPGTRYSYTTYGFNLLGSLVEAASGQNFPRYLAEHVFGPAGMKTTREDDAWAIIPHRAQGYRKGADGELMNSKMVDTSNKIPGGGLCGTPGDLVRFAFAVKNGTLLKPATVRAMWTAQKTSDGKPTHYGFGWRVGAVGGRRHVGHSGAQPRVRTQLLFFPGENIAVALMCNMEGTKLADTAARVAAILFD